MMRSKPTRFGARRLLLAFSLALLLTIAFRHPSVPDELPFDPSPTKTTTTRIVATSPFSKAPPRFIFLVGLEGTGHHLFSTLITESPMYQLLPKDDLIRLQQSLYNEHNKTNSLWTAHCSATLDSATNRIMNQVVANLQTLHRNVHPTTVTIPINGLEYNNTGVGMMSYPNYSSRNPNGKTPRCDLTKFPTIDLLYQACNRAKVTCGHIYIHRDPKQVLKSTTVNRRFHTQIEAIQLYTTMLHVIYGQFMEHPQQMVSCWDYGIPPSYKVVGQWLGFANESDFDRVIQSVYRPPSMHSHATKKPKKGKHNHDYHYASLQRAHEHVKTLCPP